LTDDYPRGLDLNLRSLEQAREYLRNAKEQINPSNVRIKKPVVTIRVLHESDADLLEKAMIGMHNMKCFEIACGKKRYFFN